MPSFNKFKNKLTSGESKGDKKAKLIPLRLTFTELPQPDDYVIGSFDDLYSKTVRVWNGSDWNDNVMNGATGTPFQSSHHVPGEGAKSRKDFKDGKFGFCLEWRGLEHEGKVHRVRCMNSFAVKSQQCTDHPKTVFKDGPNRVYDLMNWRETVTYGMIKDSGTEEAPLTDDQLKSKAVEELTNLQVKMDEAIENGQDVDELNATIAAKEKAISNKTYLLEKRLDTKVAATSKFSSPGAIYSSRKTASNSAPGNPTLDAKANRNPNDKKKRKTGYTKGFTNSLQGIKE
ncbi:hypothetical protein G6011_02324 [Alternaria panax]|uniref:Uncharacterized protein n=1 Tax=Alternaria panax TaxID=48097 RepID=A0AAD4FGS2_9PLEO|nr:hypothetical protein G6011_02324 [Alternaria panax]